ncbi:hypothetical protein [Rhodococcus opacus]|uniref:hypothetical protein n=1 Tax=Rhodococcus opacus TaxID=37919 RepID=UPI002235D5CF|nr:hypothetical protein [Rhodococcus opacus]UZG60181.1 hypothetical protein ONE62_41530 [Rhodococcus opacus]
MGIGRLSLELAAGRTAAEAEREAARVLGETGWTDLTLQTTLTTGTAGRSRYTFTYGTDDPTDLSGTEEK